MNNRQEQIEQAKRLIATGISEDLAMVLCQQFPELKESEDERMIKMIIDCLNRAVDVKYITLADRGKCLAYLERQKEQKPMYNLEIPAGDVAPAEEDGPFDEDEFLEDELSAFLQNYDKEYDDDAAVSDVARHFYEIGKKQKEPTTPEEKKNHPLYIEGFDVGRKVGQVEKEQKPVEPNWIHHKVDLSGCSEEYCKAYFDGWNNCNQQHEQLKAEQKPAEWDERIIEIIRDVFENYYHNFIWRYGIKTSDVLAWLEKQKVNTEGDFARGYDCGYECCLNSHGAEWFGKQKEQKPVEGKEYTSPDCGTSAYCGDERFEIIAQAKRDIIEKTNIAENELSMELPLLDGILMRVWQVGWLNKQPAEWGEEDEVMLVNIFGTYKILEDMILEDMLDLSTGRDRDILESMNVERDWLKDRFKSLRPHPHWKPSEEQMEALNEAVGSYNAEDTASCENTADILKSLYDDLQKLL